MGPFDRTALLAGDDMMQRLSATRVILVGVGGVGSWCAEALIRSGIGHLTIVDSDAVDVTNINRQLHATSSTVGLLKVDVLRRRLLDINPDADITAIAERYTADNAERFALESYDYVIDAIDSLDSKADLILRGTSIPGVKVVSSMGAARKIDPSKIAVTEFWRVQGDALARALRTRFRRSGCFPRRKFKCVYSPETLSHRSADGTAKGGPNGTFAHATAIFGFTLASIVIRDLYDAEK